MMSEEPQSSGSEAVTSVVGRLLQHIVALLEARADVTRQEMRAALRDVAIALFSLIVSRALLLLSVVGPPWPRRTAGAWTAPAARLRGVPAWALGALGGLLAAVWSALRRPRRAG